MNGSGVVGGAAGAATQVVNPVRRRIVPVASAVGRVGRDLGMVMVADFAGVVDAVRHGGSTGDSDGGQADEPNAAENPATATSQGTQQTTQPSEPANVGSELWTPESAPGPAASSGPQAPEAGGDSDEGPSRVEPLRTMATAIARRVRRIGTALGRLGRDVGRTTAAGAAGIVRAVRTANGERDRDQPGEGEPGQATASASPEAPDVEARPSEAGAPSSGAPETITHHNGDPGQGHDGDSGHHTTE